MRARALLGLWLAAAPVGCRTDDLTSSGMSAPRASAAAAVPVESVFAVCWPLDALAEQRVTLSFEDGDVLFAVANGASNSSGRCLREIASSWPWATRPRAPVVMSPAPQPIDGWGALAWAALLSPGRYGPSRGLTDPAPLVRACVDRGGGLGPTLRFTVEGASVKTGFAHTESARCVEAVLGSTAWPSSRDVFFEFSSLKGAPAAEGPVDWYFAPVSEAAPPPMMEPQLVRETIRQAGPQVSACWNAALTRRPGLGGARTFRFQTGASGRVSHAWVQGNTSDSPPAADYLLDRCLADVLKGLRFPGPPGSGLYTWLFAARG